MRYVGLVATGLALVPALAAGKPSRGLRFRVTELRAPEGADYTSPTGLNRKGHAVGVSRVAENVYVPTLWKGGRPELLPLLDGDTDGSAHRINQSGQIVGLSGLKAVTWRRGRITALPIESEAMTVASDINNRGQIAGLIGGPGSSQAFLAKGSNVTLLPTPDGQRSGAFGINNVGAVVGFVEPAGMPRQRLPQVWEKGRTRTLPVPEGSTYAEAFDLNDWGHVIGATLDPGGSKAVLWRRNQAIYLGELLPGSTGPMAINNRGQIVGSSGLDGEARAFLWQKGRLLDLNTLVTLPEGQRLSAAADINERGQIVATVEVGETARAVLLTPR